MSTVDTVKGATAGAVAKGSGLQFKHIVSDAFVTAFKELMTQQKNVKASLLLIRYSRQLQTELDAFRQQYKELEEQLKAEDAAAKDKLEQLLNEPVELSLLPVTVLDGVQLPQEQTVALEPIVELF